MTLSRLELYAMAMKHDIIVLVIDSASNIDSVRIFTFHIDDDAFSLSQEASMLPRRWPQNTAASRRRHLRRRRHFRPYGHITAFQPAYGNASRHVITIADFDNTTGLTPPRRPHGSRYR